MTSGTLYTENPWPNDNWTRVEVFYRVHGRLPEKRTDTITKFTIRKFLAMYDQGKTKSGPCCNLDAIAKAMRNGQFKTSRELTSRDGRK